MRAASSNYQSTDDSKPVLIEEIKRTRPTISN